MGGFLSSYNNSDDYTDDDDSSYSEQEEEILDNATKMELSVKKQEQEQLFIVDEPDNCFDSATDSVGPASATYVLTMPIVVTLSNIFYIEEQIDLYEKVSLVYLLYDDPKLAGQDLYKLLNEGDEKLLYGWAMRQKRISQIWQEKLIEALCIIQNYQILKCLGFERKDLDERFLPHHIFTSVHVNKIRKALYLLCEDLTRLETDKIIELAHSDFVKKQLVFKMFEPKYLELFFLYWETVNYIKHNDLNNLCSILKQLEYFDMVDKLKQVFSSVNVSTENFCNNQRMEKIENKRFLMDINSKTADANRKSERIIQGILSETSLEDLKSLESLDTAVNRRSCNKYKIDPQNPGVCLIINQENFYKEIDANCKHLLSENILECRKGTQKDKEDLESTFNMFNFKTEVVDNLTHSDIIEKIKKTVQNVTVESSLFVCIMSHGDEGVIYGVNSCRVKVRAIQNLMCSENRKNLSGKPKVLILQSCQGTRCQKISCDDEDITTDSPATSNKQKGVPEIVDLFTFWATVPGYGAIRNKKTGSWFIQSLCEKMKELGNMDHFEDICTAVIDDVSNKKWIKKEEDVAMVPLKETTFRHRFYLPPIKN